MTKFMRAIIKAVILFICWMIKMHNEIEYDYVCLGYPERIEEVKSVVDSIGIRRAYFKYGENSCDNQDTLIGGRLLISELIQRSPTKVNDFLDLFGKRFSDECLSFMTVCSDLLDDIIEEMWHLNYRYSWFDAQAFVTTYSSRLREGDLPREIPLFTWLRCAVQMYWKAGLNEVKKSLSYIAEGIIVPPSPTIFHSCHKKPNLSSCFLLGIDDTLESMYDSMHKQATISSRNGGIGFSVHKIRHSEVRGDWRTTGVVPLLRVFNNMIEHVRSGPRRSAAACYIRTWHIDIVQFINIVDKTGPPDTVTPNLHNGLWVDDLFEMRCISGGKWTLFCPAKVPDIVDLYGEEFEKRYVEYENDPSIEYPNKIVMDALELRLKISESIERNHEPFYMFGDACNRKSNQKNLGYISHPNLCVVGSTLILTERGYVRIEDLENQRIEVWNGYEFSEVVVRKTSEDARIKIVILNNGLYLHCTPEHKFILEDDSRIEAKDLVEGTILKKLPRNQIEFGEYLVGAYEIGFNRGHSAPLLNANLESRLEYIAGVIDSEESLESPIHYITSPDYVFAKDFCLICFTVGMRPRILVEDVYIIEIRSQDLNILIMLGIKLRVYDIGYSPEYDEYPLKVSEVKDGDNSPTFCFTEEKRNSGVFGGILTGQCTEIVQYSSPKYISSCNLTSINLKSFSRGELPYIRGRVSGIQKIQKRSYIESQIRTCYDFKALGDSAMRGIENINSVIDCNETIFEEIKIPNDENRPCGMGVSGFANALYRLGLGFEDPETDVFNQMTFACIYFNALSASVTLSIKEGKYKNFKGSPISEGKLQFDLWREEYENVWLPRWKGTEVEIYRRPEDDLPLDPKVWGQDVIDLPNGDVIQPTWEDMRRVIVKYGVRNSLLIALMPTATSANVVNNVENIEPPQNNIFSRKMNSYSCAFVVKEMIDDLKELGIEGKKLQSYLLCENGSLKDLPKFVEEFFPEYDSKNQPRLLQIVRKYKTAWEIDQRRLVDLSSQRDRYICQSQSSNYFITDITPYKIYQLQQYSFLKSRKGGNYYVRDPNISSNKLTVQTRREDKSSIGLASILSEECLSCN